MEAVKSIPLYRGGQLYLVQSEVSCFGSHCLFLAFSSRAMVAVQRLPWELTGVVQASVRDI